MDFRLDRIGNHNGNFLFKSKTELGRQAASDEAQFIQKAISERGSANIILATGANQFEMLAALVKENVDWSQVIGFHRDEYIGMPETHPSSFRKYLKERFVNRVPIKAFHFIDGENDPKEKCKRVGAIIRAHPIDVTFIGIDEHGHLALNDPPADFETEQPYMIVKSDDACSRQQIG